MTRNQTRAAMTSALCASALVSAPAPASALDTVHVGPFYPSSVTPGRYAIGPARLNFFSRNNTGLSLGVMVTLQTGPPVVSVPPPGAPVRLLYNNVATAGGVTLAWNLVPYRIRQLGTSGVTVYRVIETYSKKCMGIRGPSSANFTPVQLQFCTPTSPNHLIGVETASQYWKVTRNSPGEIQLINGFSGKCLDVRDFKVVEFAPLQVYSCSEGWNQAFRLRVV